MEDLVVLVEKTYVSTPAKASRLHDPQILSTVQLCLDKIIFQLFYQVGAKLVSVGPLRHYFVIFIKEHYIMILLKMRLDLPV